MLTHASAHYNIWLVMLAALVCAGGSLATFTIYTHLLARGSTYRRAWLALTGFCAGAGIWATHFVAMLAHDTGLPTSYDPLLTAASFAVAVVVTTAGFAISIPADRKIIGGGGAVIGLGIAAMHFLGMQALIVPGTFQWNAALVVVAIVLGVGFMAGALVVFRQLAGLRALVAGGTLFTLGVCSLHFTAMAALSIVPRPDLPAPAANIDGPVLAMAIASVTALILLAGYVVALIDARALRENVARTGELVDAAIEGLVIADDGVIVNVNARALELSNRRAKDLIGKKVFGDLLAMDRTPASSRAARLFEAPLLQSDGSTIPVEVVRRALSGLSQGNEVYAIRDLREREAAARQLAEANQELRLREEELLTRNLILDSALRNMSQGLCMYDADQKVVISNERFAAIYGLPADAIAPGMTLKDVVQKRIDNGIHAGPSPAAYLEERLTQVVKTEEMVHELNNGQIIAIARRPLRTGGWVTTHADITEQRRIEAQINHLEHHDGLTGLLSRKALRDRLDDALKTAQQRDRRLAVLMFGMDRFSEINDTLGHAVGDSLLTTIAQRLQCCTRRATLLARFGDDTFVMVEAVEHPGKDATGFANRVQGEIRKPITHGDTRLEITATIGIAVSPADGVDADTLLKNAALALNRGKTLARGAHHFFEPGMDQALRERRSLERDLAEAIEKDQFQLLYQPRVNLARNEVTGFEALLRWQHPVRGLLEPPAFLRLAEETGLIAAIGEWTLRQACAEAAHWPRDLTVAVGLSAAQFRSTDFVRLVVNVLASTGLIADRLQIEVSEKTIHSDADQVIGVLRDLSELGVRITLNDFGSGFSSLNYLRQFPVHKIKIDRSFITGLTTRGDAPVIVRMLARLGTGLGLVTMVEGVETKQQLDVVRAEGCAEMQGSYFSAPKSADEIRRLFLAKAKQAPEAAA